MKLTIKGTLKSTATATSKHKAEEPCTSTREETHVLDAVLTSEDKIETPAPAAAE